MTSSGVATKMPATGFATIATAPAAPAAAAATSATDGSMLMDDWGVFAGGSPRGDQVQDASSADVGVGGDVLSQAWNDLGLGSSRGTSTPSAAAAAAAIPENRVPDRAGIFKKRGLPQKVKKFLAALPDLKHLYSSSVVVS
ncbi:unnamed protein product [Polarella glacialis]|uniref:Uncharacterized protein n=1 Tax=Polarella glacialis TaxID=89957 RepID=A0A813E4I3_POLGL|nr:unnamed protein product [Polarella glacialis]